MTNRELFFALVKDHEPVVLSWLMAFFNERVAVELLGAQNVPADVIPVSEWRLGASDQPDWDAKVRYARATGNCAAGVGWGACIAFGHGGPAEFRERLIETGDKYRISVYETGVKKEIRRDAWRAASRMAHVRGRYQSEATADMHSLKWPRSCRRECRLTADWSCIADYNIQCPLWSTPAMVVQQFSI